MHTGWYVIQPMPQRTTVPAATSPADEGARDRLLDAAYGEIQRQGFQAASLSAILAETGLTKGALYHYFPSKKDLGLAVVDERVALTMGCNLIDDLVAPSPDAGSNDGTDSREGVTVAEPSALALLLNKMEAACHWDEAGIRLGCPLNNLMQEMSGLDEDFRQRLNVILSRWQARTESLLRLAQTTGEVRADVDCHGAALFIVAAWEGAASVAKNQQSPAAFAAAMTQLMAYVRQLQPHSQPQPPLQPSQQPIPLRLPQQHGCQQGDVPLPPSLAGQCPG